MEQLNFIAPDNCFLVCVPSRKEAVERARNPSSGLVLALGSERNDWAELAEAARNGGELNMENEELAPPHPNGGPATVLAVPANLTAELTICSGPWTRTVAKAMRSDDGRGPFVDSPLYSIDLAKQRTAADIVQTVAVGDTVHCDFLAFTDQSELMPGVYKVPVSEVVACIRSITPDEFHHYHDIRTVKPFAGYVLLREVWPAGVFEQDIDGRPTKCVTRNGLTVATGPLEGEGEVAYVGEPLGKVAERLLPGQRVVFPALHGSIHTIEGERLIAVRQDYIQAIREDEHQAVL